MPLTLEPLPPREAIDYLKAKGYQVGFAWQDVYAEEHAKAFTVAKMMRLDLLQTVHAHVVQAIEQGKTLLDFTRELRPILEKEGWWGKQELTDPLTGEVKTVQLGSPWRLQTIYDVNLRTSYAVGRWRRAQRSSLALPYLVYRSMRDSRVRELHRAWNGTLLPQDHPWWDTHYPPNGWRCRCLAYPLSEQDAENYPGARRDNPSIDTTPWVNPRTSEVRAVPVGIDPGFDYHPGKAAQAHLDQLLAEKQANFANSVGQNSATVAPVAKSAYEIAKEGGEHHGFLPQLRRMSPKELQKGIKSFEKQIAKHQSWIDDPTSKNPDFHSLPQAKQDDLIHHRWPSDIRRHRALIEIILGVLEEMGDGQS